MSPEIHYQLIVNRVTELHDEADDYRRARQALTLSRRYRGGSPRRARTAFGRLRSS